MALDPATRVAIVAAEYHVDIVQRLVTGAVAECAERGVLQVDLVPVPGAFELAPAARACAHQGYHAVIALGCVIRGGTPHFEYVCAEAARGIADVATATGIPVAFGVLTCDNHPQAMVRAGGAKGNKGREAAAAALGLLATLRALATA